MNEEYEKAIPLLRQVIRLDPNQLSAWESLGWAYWFLDQRDNTRQVWEQLRRMAPQQAEVHAWLASYHLGENNLREAMLLLEKSLSLNPAQPDVHFTLAQVYRWNGFLDESIKLLTPMLAASPERRDIRIELARALTSNWQFSEAMQLWRTIRVTDPENIEFRQQHALCHLHTGHPERAMDMAKAILEEEPQNLIALQIMVEANQYSAHPERAVPWIRRLLDADLSDGDRQFWLGQLTFLATSLHPKQPRAGWMQVAIEASHARVEADPGNVDALLTLADSYLRTPRFREAEEMFLRVLTDFNPQSERALRGLFECYTAAHRWADAARLIEAIRGTSPGDPYLYYMEATLAARKGDYHLAHEALDQLEAAGRRGAVAVLLYHSLGTSPFGQAPSHEEFRDQLQGLRDAGYVFMTPTEMYAYFEERAKLAEVPTTGPVPRIAVVTFDDVLTTSLIHGTPVARELGIVLSNHIIVHNTDRRDPYLATWDQIRRYKETGWWEFGSHSYYAHQPMPVSREEALAFEAGPAYGDAPLGAGPVDEVARRAYPLGNRIWIPEKDRLETREEFIERLHIEYGHSQAVIEKRIGVRPTYFAYPFGETGEQAASNEPEAMALNREIAAIYYDMGFKQSYYGHAVLGEHPMNYRRHEMPLRATGEETARYFLTRHPVYLAQKTRLQLAAEQGDLHLARATLDAMREAGYPEDYDEPLDLFLLRHLVVKMPRSQRLIRDGVPFAWKPNHYLGGITIDLFEDDIDNAHWRIEPYLGLNLAPNVTLDMRAGVSQYKTSGDESTSVDELKAALQLETLFGNALTLSLLAGGRQFSGDYDGTKPLLAVEGHGRLTDMMEWLLRVEHDTLTTARALPEGISQQRLLARHVWDTTRNTELWTAIEYIRYSDSNARYQFDINPLWTGLQSAGLRLGLRYTYWGSDEERTVYWTPYQSHNAYLEATFSRWRPSYFFSVNARVGAGRDAVRPASRRNAERFGFEIEESSLDPVFGVSGYWRWSWTSRVAWHIEGGHFRTPSYEEVRGSAGLEVTF